jgi:hypothetical protein
MKTMNWFEDWEYPDDHIYQMERQRDIEKSWQKWEEKNRSKQLPAIIKITSVLKHEDRHNTRTVRRADKKRV